MSLKELVTKVTEQSVKLQALEQSNKPKLEALLTRKTKAHKEC